MKLYIFYLCIGLLFLSCETSSKDKVSYDITSNEDTSPPSIEGVWELTNYYNYRDNKVTDSFTTSDGFRQVKIYSKTRVMWSKSVPADSAEWFGYGSYTVKDGELTEILDYGSEKMQMVIQEKKKFIYELQLNTNKFTQIEIDEDGDRMYSENYTRIE